MGGVKAYAPLGAVGPDVGPSRAAEPAPAEATAGSLGPRRAKVRPDNNPKVTFAMQLCT